MNEFCVNHPERACAVIIHDVTSGEHKQAPYCLDCAAEAGDTTALMIAHQTRTMDFILERLEPTKLVSEAIQ